MKFKVPMPKVTVLDEKNPEYILFCGHVFDDFNLELSNGILSMRKAIQRMIDEGDLDIFLGAILDEDFPLEDWYFFFDKISHILVKYGANLDFEFF